MIHDSLHYGPKLLDLITLCPLGWETSGRNFPCSLHPMLKKWIINGTRNYSNGSTGFSAHTDLVLFPNCPNTDEPVFQASHSLILPRSILNFFSFQAGFSKMPRCCFVPPASDYNAPYCSLIQITFPFGIQADTAKKQGQESSL